MVIAFLHLPQKECAMLGNKLNCLQFVTTLKYLVVYIVPRRAEFRTIQTKVPLPTVICCPL